MLIKFHTGIHMMQNAVVSITKANIHTREISSSGCTSLEVKPEPDSGFLMVGAAEIVAEEDTAAADGNIGFTGPIGLPSELDAMGFA